MNALEELEIYSAYNLSLIHIFNVMNINRNYIIVYASIQILPTVTKKNVRNKVKDKLCISEKSIKSVTSLKSVVKKSKSGQNIIMIQLFYIIHIIQ